MDIVNIYESAMYGNDTDFEEEYEKEEYYSGEFWDGADYLVVPNENITLEFRIDEESKEIITNDLDGEYCEYDHILKEFASDDFADYFVELQVGNDFIAEEDPNYTPDKPYIMYRGGSGYGYYRHQYKG